MSDSQSSIDGSNGVWAGVGFGSSDMINNDIVMCTYMPGNKFDCYDTWSTSNNNPKSDTSLGGKNDITASSGTITSVSAGSYKTLVTFTFTKDISNLDKFDWSNFASWQTNNGGVAGAYGYLNGSKIPLEHPAESKRLSLTDGSGYRSSITVNLGGNVNASAAVPTTTTPTAVPTTTTPTAVPTTTTPTAVPTTTTPTDGTTGTTQSSMGSSNGAQGLKYFEVFAAIFAIFLIAFI